MESEILAAIIGGAAGLFTSLLTSLLARRRLSAEIEKLHAEAKHLRAQTDALRNKPREIERAAYQDLLTNFLCPFSDFLTQNKKIYDGLLKGRGAKEVSSHQHRIRVVKEQYAFSAAHPPSQRTVSGERVAPPRCTGRLQSPDSASKEA